MVACVTDVGAYPRRYAPTSVRYATTSLRVCTYINEEREEKCADFEGLTRPEIEKDESLSDR